jgi:hypothetical protein
VTRIAEAMSAPAYSLNASAVSVQHGDRVNGDDDATLVDEHELVHQVHEAVGREHWADGRKRLHDDRGLDHRRGSLCTGRRDGLAMEGKQRQADEDAHRPALAHALFDAG